jgi:hypothetical protein
VAYVIKKLLDVEDIIVLELVNYVINKDMKLVMDFVYQRYLLMKAVNIHGLNYQLVAVKFLDVRLLANMDAYNVNLAIDYFQMVVVNKDQLKDAMYML